VSAHYTLDYSLLVIRCWLFVTLQSEQITKESLPKESLPKESLPNNQKQITNRIFKKRSPQITAFATILT
jgi:hypothetical protein